MDLQGSQGGLHGNFSLSLKRRKESGEININFWTIQFSRETQKEATKYMLNILNMLMFLNCCTKLMLNHFFLQRCYVRENDTCNSTSKAGSSCSFYSSLTPPDIYIIQVEAKNAYGIIKSDITYWDLTTISKCRFIFL